jgi:hypothetical protein
LDVLNGRKRRVGVREKEKYYIKMKHEKSLPSKWWKAFIMLTKPMYNLLIVALVSHGNGN